MDEFQLKANLKCHWQVYSKTVQIYRKVVNLLMNFHTLFNSVTTLQLKINSWNNKYLSFTKKSTLLIKQVFSFSEWNDMKDLKSRISLLWRWEKKIEGKMNKSRHFKNSKWVESAQSQPSFGAKAWERRPGSDCSRSGWKPTADQVYISCQIIIGNTWGGRCFKKNI